MRNGPETRSKCRVVLLHCLSAWLVASTTAYGSAVVALNNYDRNMPVFYLQPGALAGTGCYVEVLGGPDADHLEPISSTRIGRDAVFELSAGFFEAGIGIVPGVLDNATASFQVIAWQGDPTVNGWQTATLRVISPVWLNPTGNFTPPLMPEVAVLNFPPNPVIQPVVGPHPYPRLEISRAAGQLTVSWPSSYAGFTLEYSDTIPEANWISVAEVPVSVGDQNVVTTTVSNSARYFRLRK